MDFGSCAIWIDFYKSSHKYTCFRGKFKKEWLTQKTGRVKLLNNNRIISFYQLQQVEVIANYIASLQVL